MTSPTPPTPGGRSFLTARQIYNASPLALKQRAEYVRAFGLKITKTKGMLPIVLAASTQSQTVKDGRISKGPVYTTTIKIVDKQRHVVMDCTCGFHPFWGAEYVLHTHGAAEIKRSNGKRPAIRNPEERIMACKHLLALTQALVRKGLL